MDKKELMDVHEYIFIPRHWTRYSSIKKRGGKLVFVLG